MKVYHPKAKTSVETIRRFGELADRGGDAGVAAEAWANAGFDDSMTARWLEARCFDPDAARALTDLGVNPEQAAVRTPDGGDYLDTVGYKVANGDLTAGGGHARSLSSR
ncbi:MAG: hypothetical protein H0U12_13005 [Thermoleophilaceae bacterium]|jgi:hypothetical protein|nr:hypothetical protein [Thermoleophilaceae bacterium]